MNELGKSQQVITARGLEVICKPYVKEIFLTVAYMGEIDYFDEPTYDKKRRISDEKIGYFCSVLTNTGRRFENFWSIKKAQEMASKLSKMYNEKKGVWYEHFDEVTLKKLETITLREVYLFCKDKQ